MAIEERARGYVTRADAALVDLATAADVWQASVRSGTDEMLLHGLSIKLDNAIRKVDGKFATWAEFDPAAVETVAENGPIKLLWMLSAHPSGRVREAFVHSAKDLPDDHVLPHLANRSIDFVPAVRAVASALLEFRFARLLAERSDSLDTGALPTAAHIAVKKLMRPRTAMVSPDLVQLCVDLAMTTTSSRPGSLKAEKLDRALDGCRQTLASGPPASSRVAIETLMAHFVANESPS